MIHHSDMTDRGTFQAHATYDAMNTEPGAAYTRHFDLDGNETRLWNEGPTTPAPTTAAARAEKNQATPGPVAQPNSGSVAQ